MAGVQRLRQAAQPSDRQYRDCPGKSSVRSSSCLCLCREELLLRSSQISAHKTTDPHISQAVKRSHQCPAMEPAHAAIPVAATTAARVVVLNIVWYCVGGTERRAATAIPGFGSHGRVRWRSFCHLAAQTSEPAALCLPEATIPLTSCPGLPIAPERTSQILSGEALRDGEQIRRDGALAGGLRLTPHFLRNAHAPSSQSRDLRNWPPKHMAPLIICQRVYAAM